MTAQEASKIMDVLKLAYPSFYARQSDADRLMAVKLWTTMFSEYPLKIVGAAVKAFIATDAKGYPPNVGAIMEKCRQITEPERMSEAEAWALVKKAIQNGIYGSREEFNKLPKEVQRVVHDPAQLKAWAMDEDFNEGVESSNFKRAFRTMQEREREFMALPSDVQRIAIEAGAGMAMDGKLLMEWRNKNEHQEKDK
jgi:hypothetical protein